MLIAYGIADVEYRKQVLRLTPLGSSYEDVEAFIINEAWFQEGKPLDRYRIAALQLRQFVDPVERNHFALATCDLVRFETPHIEIADLNNPFAVRKDRRYTDLHIYHRPLFWRNEIEVQIYYIFDEQNRLIDAFAYGTELTPTGM